LPDWAFLCRLHHGSHRESRTVKESLSALLRPAYKAIPISVAASISLWEKYGVDVSYCSAGRKKRTKVKGNEVCWVTKFSPAIRF
jgi:orotate phosphoribosyltransferase